MGSQPAWLSISCDDRLFPFSRLNGSMIASSHAVRNLRTGAGFSALIHTFLLTFVLTASLAARAQGTHLWTQSKLEEFEKRDSSGSGARE